MTEEESFEEHECNDCGIMIPSWRPICTLCERWYEDRGLPLPSGSCKWCADGPPEWSEDAGVWIHRLDAERAAHQETQAKLDSAAREIRVAAAVIEQDGLVRIFRRGGNDSYTGKWEFPGGKAEPGESLADALRRELREELAVESEIGAELDHYQYKYAKRGPISLTFFSVKLLGSPEFLEHTESAWVKPEQLADYDLMNGDMKFVATRYTLTRQLAEAQAISRELQADKDRLDWLGSSFIVDEIFKNERDGSWFIAFEWAPTIREAIDVARAKARGVLPAALPDKTGGQQG